MLVTADHSETQDGVWVGQTKLQNLASGSQYSVSVASANSFGFSPFGEAYTFTTVDIGMAGCSEI